MTARGKGLAALVAVMVCASAGPAHAATIRVDGDDQTPDSPCGPTANPCNTIAAGIEAADPDDTVSIATAAAPYAEAITIEKPGIKLVGPGQGVAGADRGSTPDLTREAVIDVQPATTGIVVTAGGVRVDGLFFTGAGPGVELASDTGEIRNSVFAGQGPGVLLAGAGQLISLNLFAQQETDTGAYGVLAASAANAAAIRQNRFEGEGQAMALRGRGVAVEGNTVAGRSVAAGVLIDLRDATDALVRGNTLTAGLIGLAVSGVSGVTVEANDIAQAGARAISVDASLDLGQSRGVMIVRNQLSGNGGQPGAEPAAGIFFAAGALADEPAVVANRFIGQAANGVPAIGREVEPDGQRVVAADNWWGCNGGPAALGCDYFAGDGIVAAPWLVLSAGAMPNYTPAPGLVRVGAGIQRDSAGHEVPDVALLRALPFEFAKLSGPGTLGAVSSSGGGAAQVSFESAIAGVSAVRAALDSAAIDVAVEFTGAPLPPAPPVAVRDTRKPRLRDVQASRSGRGITLRFTLSEPAVVRFSFERVEAGSTAGLRCAALRRGHRPNCRRRVPVGSSSTPGIAGANTRWFSGRLARRALKPGIYRASLAATDAAGNAGAPQRAVFRIARGRPGS